MLALHFVVWTVLPTLLYANLPLDLIEALTYGREWQLGYDKLPPLPWWLVELAYRAFGTDAAYYAMAQVAVLIAFTAVWLTAVPLVGARRALIAILIIDGLHYFQFTAVKFNHDVIQLPLWGLAGYSGTVLSVVVLVALLVTLIPTTIGGLLSAIGIAGMDRLIRFNVIATSGRAVEAAGDVDTLLLDKTGTITFGNRMASEFLANPGVDERALAEAAMLASLGDETPEGKSIVALARGEYDLVEPQFETAPAVIHRIASKSERLVFLSSPHQTPHPFFQQPNPAAKLHADIERLIAESGLASTMVRPGMFDSNVVPWWSAAIRS